MENKDLLTFAKKYCRERKVKLKIREFLPVSGMAELITRTVYIDSFFIFNNEEFLSIFFHEMMHFYCMDNGIFPLYHNSKIGTKSPDRTKAKIRSQAYRAEKHVDKLAKKEMKKYFPELKFRGTYLTCPARNKRMLKEFWK